MAEREPLAAAYAAAVSFLEGVAERPVSQPLDYDGLRVALDGTLGEDGEEPEAVVSSLVELLEPAVIASAGPRFFGFVIGGAVPAAVAADWLTSAWDQNAGLYAASPAAAAVEDVVGGWLLDVLGLPAGASVGLVTGATMATLVGLAAGRHRVLTEAGWDVEDDGLYNAPPLNLVCGEEAHASLFKAAQILGLGRRTWKRVEVDEQGRMRAGHFREVLARCEGPTIVAAQAGNVNSGAFDPLEEIAEACREHGAWLHVDGAFGLWVRASEQLAHLAAGAEQAQSWAADAHKWLNVPYDCGIAVVADPEAHRAAMSIGAAYLIGGVGRDGLDWVPESSRRSRGLTVYAALRQLGRRGLGELIDRCCAHARRFAERLGAEDGIDVLNDVVMNQVVLTFEPPPGENPTSFRDRVAAAIQADGTCWAGGTLWRDTPALRLSVSNWRTTTADVDRSADAIIDTYRKAAAG